MKLRSTLSQLAHLPRRLSVQLSLLLSLLIGTTLIAHAWLMADRQTQLLQDSMRTQAATLADAVASGSAPLMVVDDLASIEDQLLRTAALPGVLAIRVSGPDQRILSEVAHAADGTLHPIYTPARLTPPASPRATLAVRPDGDIDAWAPITNGAEIGWVQVVYSLAEARAVRPRILKEAAFTAAVAILINLWLLFLYLRRPLRAIRLATEFSSTLNTRRGNEIAVNAATLEIEQLQRSLNFASQQLWQEHQAMTESAERLQAVLTYTADGLITLSERGIIESCNPAAERIFGSSSEAMQGCRIELFVPHWRNVRTGQHHETTGRRADGVSLPLELSVTEMWVGNQCLYTATVRDLSNIKRLEQLSSRLGRILEHSSNEIYIFDAQTLRFVQVSEGARTNLGYRIDELLDMTPIDIMPGMTREQFTTLIQPLRDGTQEMVAFESVHRRKDGSLYPVEVRLQLSRTENPPVFVAIIQDITARRHAEARLVYLANYDTLTDLPNRVLLSQRLGKAIEEAEHIERLVAVLFIDLDRFKVINDTLGHDSGDELLKVVARRLSEAVRPGDTVARYGGDEFVIVLANVAHIDDVTKVVHKILGRLSPAITIGGRELFVTPSIGITLCPFDDRTSDELLRNADSAMFDAKEQGGNTFRFYTAEMNARTERRLTLETSLRHALERGEFLLHYQPQVDMLSGKILGAEALIRWQHPDWGLVSPAEFIPLAEETGLILPIGEWVLAEACAQARAWHAAGHASLRIAVNLSGRQLAQKNLTEIVATTLSRCTVARGMLELEITESLLMQDLEQTADTLTSLAALGVTVSMDDFGTGYSSLSYLKRLPIDVLKIDQSFVRDITKDPDDAAIVQAIIAMAHSLGIKVIAEGVETAEQLAFLRQHRCDAMQGYYFSRPVPPEQFAELLRRSVRANARR
jgi:diguanylate cyclase (GGDEF)-like protein/PAS domain S-box-containing protein